MTADAPSTDPVQEQAAAATRSEQALVAYRHRLRRSRGIYFGVVTAVVAALVVVVAVAWSHGEVAHTSLKTAATAAPNIAPRQPADAVTQAWTSSDHAALGVPYWGGTVVTYSAHTVSGRNGATGAVTWSYRRSDRTVCVAAQTQGLTIAVYMLNGNCDEVTALDSQTGKRAWTRTLDENGQPVFGQPTYQITPEAFLVVTPSVIYSINTEHSGPYAGSDNFVFGQQSCTIHSAVVGSAGALISQTCQSPACVGLTYCRAGNQLLLRRAGNITQTNAEKTANPDQILWNLANNTDVPAAADSVVAAFTPDRAALATFDLDTGAKLTQLAVDPAPATLPGLSAVQGSDRELIWAGGVAYALSANPPNSLLWTARTTSAPTLTGTDPQQALSLPDPATSVVAAPVGPGVVVTDPTTGTRFTGPGVELLDPTSGRPTRFVALSTVAAGAQTFPLGSGFVVAGASTTVYR